MSGLHDCHEESRHPTSKAAASVIIMIVIAGTFQIIIVGTWLHSKELDHDGALNLPLPVPKPSALLCAYRATPSVLAVHWIGVVSYASVAGYNWCNLNTSAFTWVPIFLFARINGVSLNLVN